jgi:hypothetical protein
MLIPWNVFTRSLESAVKIALSLAALTHVALAANGVMPIDDTEIHLPDGRKVEAVRCGTHCHCLVIKRGTAELRRLE